MNRTVAAIFSSPTPLPPLLVSSSAPRWSHLTPLEVLHVLGGEGDADLVGLGDNGTGGLEVIFLGDVSHV